MRFVSVCSRSEEKPTASGFTRGSPSLEAPEELDAVAADVAHNTSTAAKAIEASRVTLYPPQNETRYAAGGGCFSTCGSFGSKQAQPGACDVHIVAAGL